MSTVVITVLVMLVCPMLSWGAANGDVREVRLTAKSRFVTPEFRMERPLALPEAESLLWGPAMPKDFGQQSPKGILDGWQELVKKRFDSLSAADCREQLKVVLGIESPGHGTAVLIHPERMEHAARLPIMNSLIQRGLSVLHIEPFESGSEASSSRQQLAYLTFQRSDDANRIQDILVAASYERDREPQSTPRLVCPGRAGIWCLLAAAVSDRPMIIECDRRSFGGTAQDVFLPGFELAGGLEAALRAGGFQELSGTKESVELRSRPQTIE